MTPAEHWSQLSAKQRSGVVAGALQVVLLVAALVSVRRAPEDEIRGSRRAWTLACFVNWVGPLAWFAVGRRRPAGNQ